MITVSGIIGLIVVLTLFSPQVNSYPTVRGFTAIGTGGDDFVQAMVVAVESVLQQPIPKVCGFGCLLHILFFINFTVDWSILVVTRFGSLFGNKENPLRFPSFNKTP